MVRIRALRLLSTSELTVLVRAARLEGEGDAEIARGGDEAKSSLAFIQLEKQNARLREALLR